MMPKHLKQELLVAFQELIGKNFTIGQALGTYMASSSCIHSEVKAARQFVYRIMLRLMESGELDKISVRSGRPKYCFSEKFRSRLSATKSIGQVNKFESGTIKSDSSKNLTERLNHQKLELLTAMGEAEEYNAIHKEIPEMREKIQPLYNDSRERCSKLLGKVKALENLISLSAR